jgi:membrane protein YqaA with SNARE-associated domain
LEHFLHYLFRLAYQAGAFGLFCVGVLDSSFLFVPLGNDFLMLGLSARHHDRVPYYVIAATAGSVCGILLTLWVSKKGGEKIKHKRGRTWKYVESQMKKNAGWALTIGSLMPPPFPFTLFVAAAGALRVPLKKVLPYVAAGRLLRFTIEGVLAIVYGRWILSLANSPALKITMIVMIVIAIASSAYSVFNWVRH